MADWGERVARAFPNSTIPKRLVKNSPDLGRIPRYVAEYLLAQKTEEKGSDILGLHAAEDFVRTYCPRAEDRNRLKHDLTTKRQIQVLDLLSVDVDLPTGNHWATLPCLDGRLRITPMLAEKYKGLLYGGMYGMCTVVFEPDTPGSGVQGEHPARVSHFVPLQTDVPDINQYRQARAVFSCDEWADLLISSAGLNPQCLGSGDIGWRLKLLVLTRLLPFVERNVNLVELGPKNTGKTYTLRNTSSYAFVISGGRNTPANLFVNLRTNQIGIIGMKKVVIFDEIGRVQLTDQDAVVSILKDYMESGQYSRGRTTYASDAGIIFIGNIEVDGSIPSQKYAHLFQPLALAFQDTALLDRIHGFLPGWELPKIGTNSLAEDIGLLSDYFAEILNLLREIPFESVYNAARRDRPYMEGMTRRDETAIAKISRGLLKLLFPNGDLAETDKVDSVLLFAAELRQRVHNQLTVMDPGEFRDRRIGFEDLNGDEPEDFQVNHHRIISRHDVALNTQPSLGEATALVVLQTRNGDIIGGDVQIIEVSALLGTTGLEINGAHDQSMKHSARAAYNYVREHARDLHLPPEAVRSRHISIHLLYVASQREGPSAGLAFVLGIISALSGYPLVPALAVTGEVSQHGKVTAVGGIPQKLAAAKAHGRKKVILPRDNEPEIQKLEDEIRDLEIICVDTVTDALNHALQPAGSRR